MKATLREFWNQNADDLTTVFVAGTAIPAGCTYTRNLNDEGEDYCDLYDLITTGLFAQDEVGDIDAWDATGEVENGEWRWDGSRNLTDSRGNNYSQFVISGG